MRGALICGVLAGVVLAAAARAAELPLTGELQVTLQDAVWRKDTRSRAVLKFPLQVDFTVEQGKWNTTAYGYAIAYNKGEHDGTVENATVEGDRIRIAVPMQMNPDAYSPTAGTGRYTISLQKDKQGWTGTYTGTFNGLEMTGKASATLRPLPPRMPNFVPVQPREHPRLLVRKSDLPKLRERAKTQWGKSIVAGLEQDDSGVALAWRYALTGDRALATAAKEKAMGLINAPGNRMLEAAGSMHALAIIYDFCYDGWDEPFRKSVTQHLENASLGLLKGGGIGWNDHPWSNWQGRARAGSGMAALAILGEPADLPPKPLPARVVDLTPPKDFKPGDGVPVLEEAQRAREGEEMTETGAGAGAAPPYRWLYAGPFPAKADDPLAALGGVAAATPERGTKAGGDRSFQPLEHKFHANAGLADAVDITALLGKAAHTTTYFYSTLEAPGPRVVKVSGLAQGAVYIAGQKMNEGTHLRLAPGTYPVMVQATLGPVPPVGKPLLRLPRIEDVEDPAHAQARWEANRKKWEDSGRTILTAQRSAEVSARAVRRWTNTALGDHGWNSEGEAYTFITLELVQPFLHAHRNVLGTDLAANNNVEWALPIYAARAVYNGRRFTNNHFGVGGGGFGDVRHQVAEGFTLTPPDLQPAVLWHWQRAGGPSGPMSLVTWPEGMQARNPGDVFGHVIADRQKGAFIFRNQWKDADDIVATLFLKSDFRRASWSTPESGTFRIYGLGRHWAVRGPVPKAGERTSENVVLVDEETTPMVGGKTLSLDTQADGSGTVVADMSNTYLGRTSTSSPVDLQGNVVPEDVKDLGIKATRAFAVDYSGNSGVPALFVIADHLTAGTNRTWQMFTPVGTRDDRAKVAVTGNTFTITDGDTALHATFIAPANVQLAIHEANGQQAIRATGGDRFYVVMTLQRGKPPMVESALDGDRARVQVGKQTISIEPRRITLGK